VDLLVEREQEPHDDADDDGDDEPDLNADLVVEPVEPARVRGRPTRLRLVIACHLRPLSQVRRVAMKRAAAIRLSARGPNGASAFSALSTTSSSRFRAASGPSRATRVALPLEASLA